LVFTHVNITNMVHATANPLRIINLCVLVTCNVFLIWILYT